MSGSAYIFINYAQAVRFGHVGWGFALQGSDEFYFGSTDHLLRQPYWNLAALIKYMSIPAAADNDWWADVGSESDMLRSMGHGHHIRYHAYKVVKVADARPASAQAAAESLRLAGWNVAGNNCVHQVYEICRQYGAADLLPDPAAALSNLIPRLWFARIAGDCYHLS